MTTHRLVRTGVLATVLACVVSVSCNTAPSTSGEPSPPAAAQAATPSPAPGDAPSGASSLLDQLSAGKAPADRSRPVEKPMAESTSTERAPAALTLAPAQGDRAYSSSLIGLLPQRPEHEVRGAWIGWYVNRAIDGLREAIDRNRPLVLVVSEGWCSFCNQLIANTLRCPAVERFAGEAVFAYSHASEDAGAGAVAGSLEIASYPTITVLEPEARMLLERGRINGLFEASTLGMHLDTILRKTKRRRYEDEQRGGLWFVQPLHAQGFDTGVLGRWGNPDSKTQSSGTRDQGSRDLKHAPPAPQCR
jgi:hypothetical protein